MIKKCEQCNAWLIQKFKYANGIPYIDYKCPRGCIQPFTKLKYDSHTSIIRADVEAQEEQSK